MATTSINYSSNNTLTIDLSALASSSSFTSGRESNEVDNSTDKYLDAIVQGKFTVGTTPATTGGLMVYVWGSNVSLATTALDVLDGVDSAETFTTTSLGATVYQGIFVPVLVNTSNAEYQCKNFSVAKALGLPSLPKYWGIYVSQNTGVALKTDAANTNSFTWVGIKYDIA